MISSFTKVGISFILGITLFTFYGHIWLHIILGLFLIFLSIWSPFRKSIFLLITCFFLGGIHAKILAPNSTNNLPQSIEIQNEIYLVDQIKSNENYTQLEGRFNPNSHMELKAQLTFRTNKKNVEAGDILSIEKSHLEIIPENPFKYCFDFNSLLLQKEILYKSWLDSDKFHHIGSKNSIQFQIQRIRKTIENQLDQDAPKISGFLMALCLGEKSNLNKDTNNLFIQNGVAHIMAVSGLHIGIVYLIFLNLVKLIARNKKIFAQILPVALIWVFILITGAPVSAVRAGLMISIYVSFVLLGRKNEKLHMLTLTAVIILLISPNELSSIGFQLSFMALIGILYFTDFFFEIFKSKNVVLNYFSSIIAMSLAVQITTLPLTIYYFHSFPLHFLLTNIIAIPFAFIVLIFFLLYLSFLFLPLVSKSILSILEYMIDFVIDILSFFERFEYLFLKDLHFSKPTLILYYVFLIVLFGVPIIKWSLRKKSFYLFAIVFFAQMVSLIQFDNEEFVYVFNQKGVCVLVKTRNQIVLFHEKEQVNLKYFHPLIRNHVQTQRIESNTKILIDEKVIAFNLEKEFPVTQDENVKLIYSEDCIPLEFKGKQIYVSKKMKRKHPNLEVIDHFIQL